MPDPARSFLPTFFIIGAAKSGTTSLHFYMDAHPEIAMTDPKEPHVLIGPGWRTKTTRYQRLFKRRTEIRGEASPGYSVCPKNADAPGNIAALVPEARLIYLVRDPVERAIAHYAQAVTVGRESRTIEEALDTRDPYCEYVAASRYATQVEAYLEHFSEHQLVVLDHSDLREERRETIASLYEHVGADSSFWDPVALERDYNVRAADNVMLPGPLQTARSGRLNSWSKRALPHVVRRPLVSAIRRIAGSTLSPTAGPELRERLAGAFEPEVARLRELTGLAFADWRI